MLLGRAFLARDINPLAILLCNAKKGPFFADAAIEKAAVLLDRITNDIRSISATHRTADVLTRRDRRRGLAAV